MNLSELINEIQRVKAEQAALSPEACQTHRDELSYEIWSLLVTHADMILGVLVAHESTKSEA